MTDRAPALSILGGSAEGPVVASPEALSFWGGVDPATGKVIDVHHPLHGETITGGILMMPSSRGSCTGSGVLLDLALTGRAPAALVFSEAEDVLTLGDAIIAVAIETAAPGVAPLPVADDPFAEGPFGFDEQAAEAVKAAILPDTAAENARDKVAVLQDWWIPTADGRHGEPKPVDISGGMGNASIARTNAAGEAVASIADTGTNFAAEALGLDAAVFAKAVETAMLVLSVEEKRRFEGRLVELLRKEKSG